MRITTDGGGFYSTCNRTFSLWVFIESLLPIVHQIGCNEIARRADQTYWQPVYPNYGFTIALANVYICEFYGLGLSVLANWCDYLFKGVGVAGFNLLRGDCSGLFVGAAGNYCGDVLGVMLGLWNYAEVFRGVQVGLVNVCGSNSVGVQLGALNFRSGSFLPSPLVALRFGR